MNLVFMNVWKSLTLPSIKDVSTGVSSRQTVISTSLVMMMASGMVTNQSLPLRSSMDGISTSTKVYSSSTSIRERSSSSRGAFKWSGSIWYASAMSMISEAVGFVNAIQQPGCISSFSCIAPSSVLKIRIMRTLPHFEIIRTHYSDCPAVCQIK